MLEINDSRIVSKLLSQMTSSVELPENWDVVDGQLAGTLDGDTRQWPRKHFCRTALLQVIDTIPVLTASRVDSFSKVFTKDVSRHGISFYHSTQLYPTEICKIWVSTDEVWQVRVVRCSKLAENRYLVGTELIDDTIDH